jgi:hypothetical protein
MGSQSKALWRSWLARRPVTAEVAGSSPVRVATAARHTGAFRPGSSVGMSVRLKSGRSPVRSRPWPPALVQFSGHFCSVVEPRVFESALAMGPIWGQNEPPPSARLLRWPDLGRRGSRVRPRCRRARRPVSYSPWRSSQPLKYGRGSDGRPLGQLHFRLAWRGATAVAVGIVTRSRALNSLTIGIVPTRNRSPVTNDRTPLRRQLARVERQHPRPDLGPAAGHHRGRVPRILACRSGS